MRLRRNELGNRALVNMRDGSNVNYVIKANTSRYTQMGQSSPECQGQRPRRSKNVPDTFNFFPAKIKKLNNM
jgi:hypothetical protein